MEQYIKNNNIKQCYISESLKNDNLDYIKSITKEYKNLDDKTIFVGMYNLYDLLKIKFHKGDKVLFWTGNDANICYSNRIKIINSIKMLNIEKNIASSIIIQKNLKYFNIKSIFIDDLKFESNNFDINKLKQIYISESLIHLKEQFFKKYPFLSYYNDNNENCIFFGLYTKNDYDIINSHKAKKYLIWGGTDLTFENDKIFFLNYLDKKNLHNIAISKNLFNRLCNFNFNPIYFNLNLVDTEIFKPVKQLGNKIFIYNGVKVGNEEIYGKSTYEEVVKKMPEYEFIYSNNLNLLNSEMPNIYKQCFIGLRLTKNDGNANMVQEIKAMKIPVVHNLSDYGLKWENVDDIINHIKSQKVDEFNITNDNLNFFFNNIDQFSELISEYKNILFVCSDKPGYGGAATNCECLQNYYSKNHNTFSIYYSNEYLKSLEYSKKKCIINANQLEKYLEMLPFQPDLIILKSFLKVNIRKFIKCPIFYCIGGIFTNNLDKHYTELKSIDDYDKYINKSVLRQIRESDRSFCNSKRTRDILKNIYNLDTTLFYSGFVPFYRQKLYEDSNFDKRKYDYGLIISNFDRKVKNCKRSIEFLKDKKNVILIGKNSSNYKNYGFECIENIDHKIVQEILMDIKFIQQDSFFESYSNIMIESKFNGCKIKKNIIVSSTQYPGYGGAATNAYAIIKFLRKEGYNTAGVFFHSKLDVNPDPDNLGGIFLYDYKFKEDIVLDEVVSYLGGNPQTCLAKNYMAPIYCKSIFNCYTVYLVSGINHLPMFYKGKTASDVLDDSFLINEEIPKEIKCNEDCDLIVLNSKLSFRLFNKIYPTFKDKIHPEVIDTTNQLNLDNNLNCDNKEYDILICCSCLNRRDKNNMFLIDVLKNNKFDKYKKIIIGENYDRFKEIPNSICTGLLDQKKCTEYMSKCKILLFPSLADANSNTVREAYFCKCLPLITENVGYHELFPDFLICKNYEESEWSCLTEYVLDNYDSLKNTKINFNDKCNNLLSIL